MSDNFTASGTYPDGRVPHFVIGGHCNVAAYAPGEKADAFPGSPVFDLHVTVLWYPGRIEEIVVHADAAMQHRWHREHGFVQ